MSLAHAILGFLQVMPMTGYDLKTQAFDRSVAHFWPAVQQQIYRELDKLHAQGWVTYEVEVQTDRPSRKVYTITDAGRAAFAEWLAENHPTPKHREPFLIQLLFGAQLTNAQMLDLLAFQRAAHLERLAALQSIVIPPMDDPGAARRHPLSYLTLDFGVRLQQLYVDWLDEAMETVKNLPEG